MFTKLNSYIRTRHPEDKEQGSALIFALVLLIVMFSIVTIITSVSLTSLKKTADLTKYSNNEAAAQTAISNAVSLANNQLDGAGSAFLTQHLGKSKAVTGTYQPADGTYGINWEWYTQRISNQQATSQFYVIATGFQGDDPDSDPMARTLRATVHSLGSVEGQYITIGGEKTIAYVATGSGLSQWGMFATEQLNLHDGVQVRSYVSDVTFDPTASTRQGTMATSGDAQLGGSQLDLDFLNILNYSTGQERCEGPGCGTPVINKMKYSVSNKVTDVVQDECPNPAISYPTWVASENSGKLEGGCYNTLLFDMNTVIPASYNHNHPAKVYIKGNITIEPGVDVNNAGDPTALLIYSQGGDTAEFLKGSTTNPTKFYGVLNSASLRCTDDTTNTAVASPATPNLYIYGSLICSTINMGNGTVLWWDELTAEIQDDVNKINRVWWVESIVEINS